MNWKGFVIAASRLSDADSSAEENGSAETPTEVASTSRTSCSKP
jgi:hypothetical protein